MAAADEHYISDDGSELNNIPKELVDDDHPAGDVATEILDCATSNELAGTSQNVSFDFAAGWGDSPSTKKAPKKKHRTTSLFE